MPTYTDCSGLYNWGVPNVISAPTNTNCCVSGPTVNMTPTSITWTTTNKQEEYIEKLEKHIDELEEDIEYFNKQLQEKDEVMHLLLDQKDELEKNIDNQKKDLEKKISNMDSYVNYLEARLQILEDKINK